MDEVRVGIVGCGLIASELYLPGIRHIPRARVVALCDHDPSRREVADRWGIERFHSSIDELVAAGDVDVIVNATPIPVHAAITRTALAGGLHVYTEKTLAAGVREADELIDLARRQGLLIACAPDTMAWPYATELATLVRSRKVGQVAWARLSGSHGGPEHGLDTDVRWYYRHGAGPMRDMGVYAIDLATGLFGPAVSVAALATISRPTRRFRRGAHVGTEIRVEVEDNVLLILEFADGLLASIDAGFCTVATRTPVAEVYGAEGTISVDGAYMSFPDGATTIHVGIGADPDTKWRTDGTHTAPPPTTAMGVAHLVDCLLDGIASRLTPERGRHVVEIMEKAVHAVEDGTVQTLETTF